MEETNISQIIIDTINSILSSLFSSIDNNLYSVLDEITFIGSNILKDKNFENIFGTSNTKGILLISNSLIIGFLLYYSIKLLFSHFTYSKIESPYNFLLKLIIYTIFMNCSYYMMTFFWILCIIFLLQSDYSVNYFFIKNYHSLN